MIFLIENGPCPLVAICNVLFLRGDLEIRPPDREMVTFEYLIERLGDYLLNHGPNTSSNNNATDESKVYIDIDIVKEDNGLI